MPQCIPLEPADPSPPKANPVIYIEPTGIPRVVLTCAATARAQRNPLLIALALVAAPVALAIGVGLTWPLA